MPRQVRVGVGVFILSSTPSPTSFNSNPKNPTFLLGIRLNSHGSGTQALPGGHLEFGETFEECAIREVLEETGLQITKPKFLTATNDFISSSSAASSGRKGEEGEDKKEDKKHYVTVFMVCERLNQEDEPENREPEKCGGWEWVDWESLVKWVDDEGQEENKGDGMRKKVFTPLISLIRQRPGLVPSTALSEQD